MLSLTNPSVSKLIHTSGTLMLSVAPSFTLDAIVAQELRDEHCSYEGALSP